MINKTYQINASIDEVWQALVDPEVIEKWSGDKATMSDEPDSKFSLWGGSIWSTNTEVIRENRLAQDWYGGDWGKPSKVLIELRSDDQKTIVTLTHNDCPESEEADFDRGWDDYYFGPLIELIEIKR